MSVGTHIGGSLARASLLFVFVLPGTYRHAEEVRSHTNIDTYFVLYLRDDLRLASNAVLVCFRLKDRV